MSENAAHAQPTKQAQSVALDANVTSWGSERHYLEQELPGLAVIQKHT